MYSMAIFTASSAGGSALVCRWHPARISTSGWGQHNRGESKSTRHGVPWVLIHSEQFRSRAEAVRRERQFKTGAGRDFLDRLEV